MKGLHSYPATATWHRPRRVSAVAVAGALMLAGLAAAAVAYWTVTVLFAPTNYALAQAGNLSAPTTPTATATGGGAITVGWTLPGTQVTGTAYQVKRTGPGSPTVVCASVSTSSCQDTGLTASTTYSYSIYGVLGNWQSSAITASATTATPTLAIALSSPPYTAGAPVTVASITAKLNGSTDTTYSGQKTINWSGLANAPSGQGPTYPPSTLTFVSGVASPASPFTAYAAGASSLTATDAAATGVTGSASFTVAPASATQLAFSPATPGPGSPGVAIPNVAVAVQDSYGNKETSLNSGSVVMSIKAGSPQSTFTSGTTTIAVASGVASFTNLVVSAQGSYTFTATPSSITGVSAAVNSNPFSVAAGTATRIVLSGSSTNLASGTNRTVTATIQDSAGNTVMTGPDSTRSVTFAQSGGTGSVSGLGSVTATAGVANLTVTGNLVGSVSLQASATLNGVPTNSGTLSFSVVNGTATQIVLSGSTGNLAGGVTRTFTATIKDAAGNTVTSGADSTDTITFSKTSGSGTVTGLGSVGATGGVANITVTGGLAGSVSLQASGTVNGAATTSNTVAFSVVTGTASQIVLSGSSGSLAGGVTRTFTATIEDGGGNVIASGSDSSASVSLSQSGSGTVTGPSSVTATAGVANFTVTGGKAGSVTLQASATLNGTLTNSVTLSFNVTTGTVSKIVLSGSTASLMSGITRTVSASIQDGGGNVITTGPDSTPSVTFSQSGTGSVSGLTSVTATAGVANLTVTGNNDGAVTLSASANLTSGATTSNGLGFTITQSQPTFATISPNSVKHNAVQTVVITGSDFVSGASVSFTGAGTVIVNSVVFNSSSQLTVNITGGTGNQTGVDNLTITNPDGGTVTTTTNPFQVT